MSRRPRYNKMPKGLHQATINSLSHEGRGVADLDGKATFIQNALPTETVTFRYTESHSRYDCGFSEEIITPSVDRVEPPCRFNAQCGGCSLQHLSYDTQVAFKQNVFSEQLLHFGRVAPETLEAPLLGDTLHYRHKARLGVRCVDKKEKVLIGFRERGGRFLTDMNDCSILHPRIATQLERLQQLIYTSELKNKIAQLEVAVGDTDAAIIVRHLEPLPESDLALWDHFYRETGIYIYSQAKGPDTIKLLFAKDQKERLHYRLDDFDIDFAFHPTDFTQVNPSINKQMVRAAIDWLSPTKDDTVLDLFCGLGNFTLPLAKQGAKVIGVEGSVDMVKRGYENMALNNIKGADFFTADLHAPFQNPVWGQQVITKVLIDPPRSGAEEIVKNMEKINPSHIVYVSCNPTTLARDAGILVREKGYRFVKARIMDMFPQTSHTEAMALFVKEKTK